jgi:murein DD-endopeptidase MepM/ murein hydrolase activator NlpD
MIAALTAALALLCCGGGTAAVFLTQLGGESDSSQTFAFGCGNGKPVELARNLPRAGGMSDQQMHNSAVIISVGQKLSVPPRGWVIAIATALQESNLVNLGNLGSRNDHDSLGLFQQRPSQGWGTPEQVMDPVYSSTKFFEKLLLVPGWQGMALTDAAQRVQRSAYPDAYAKHEPRATLVVNLLTDGAARAVGDLSQLRCTNPGEISASGWVAPVSASIVSGFRTADRPNHYGVDLGVGKGTEVRAASAGVVVTVLCGATAPDGSNWGCDRDGGAQISGCGWYVEILHAGNVLTRYCHLVSHPPVSAGQRVAAAATIGRSGSSGNSSGPHLHFEVHLNGDRSNNGAVDPARYMKEAGAPLGDRR